MTACTCRWSHKIASPTEDGVAHVSYIYLMNTYINIYNDMYGVLGPPARRGFCRFLPLEPWNPRVCVYSRSVGQRSNVTSIHNEPFGYLEAELAEAAH